VSEPNGRGRWNAWPEHSRPIDVEGGIQARSRRGAIGEQWWSRRFIDVLESFGMSGRLARGRNYARRGQVIGFELTTGYVTAQVQGSRPKPYSVRIQVLPLTVRQWAKVELALAAQALFRAKLLAGEMPHEIEEVFAACGTPLFPRSVADMDMHCSCPDWEVPCKHLAAICYVLAEAFDDDPFAMLAWRGRNREELLGSLRLVSAPDEDEPRPVIAVTDRPLAECLDGFWSPGLSPARLRTAVGRVCGQESTAALATAPDLLLRSFEPPAVAIRGRNLADLLTPAYEHLGDAYG
jgi:uncharacterized Zn finger protein